MAYKLPARRAIYTCDNGFETLFTTNLRNKDGSSRIQEYIKNAVDPNKKLDSCLTSTITNIPLKPEEKTGGKTEFTPTPPQSQLQFPSQSFDKINKAKTPEEILKENISKIPGFVPWTPSDPNKIIDKTNEAIQPSPLASKKGGKTPC
jgi:hypothetical protein